MFFQMLTLTLWVFLYWQNREQLNQPSRRGKGPYARWRDRESPWGHTYVDNAASKKDIETGAKFTLFHKSLIL